MQSKVTKRKPAVLSARTGAARWPLLLCAFVLVLAQSLLQLHAVKHFSGDSGEPDSCQLCLAGGSFGNAVTAAAGAGLLRCHDITPTSLQQGAIDRPVAFAFRPRAPPLVPPTT
jgi:hypothetical protein